MDEKNDPADMLARAFSGESRVTKVPDMGEEERAEFTRHFEGNWYVEPPENKPRTRAEIARLIGIPPRVADDLGTLSRPVPEQGTAWAGTVEGDGPWLWIMGGTGAGKTCAAAYAACTVYERARAGCLGREATIRFVTSTDLMEQWNGGNLYGPEQKTAAIRPYRDATFLFLDGLGEEAERPAVHEALWAVLDRRYRNKRPTVITTQYGAREYAGVLVRAGVDQHDAAALMRRVSQGIAGYGPSLSKEDEEARVVEIAQDDTEAI